MTATAVPDLPPRMRQVLDALHRGLTVADTARELHVDEGTVRAHHEPPEPIKPGHGRPASRCTRPGCGCLRYRPNLTKGTP